MYKVKLPKILFLVLDIAYHYHSKRFFNTNDLVKLANKFGNELVRQRSDKKDYKYLEDTRFGGLRGNLSTLLTLRGFVRKGNTITGYYGIGKDDRLVNAVMKGEIVLHRESLTAHTNNERLKSLLETESYLLTVRENQAHIGDKLKKDGSIPLTRDKEIFPKESVVFSPNRQYFIRALVNNFINQKNTVLEYSLIGLWNGTKFRKKNLHPLFVIPTQSDSWSDIYTVKNEELYDKKPLFLRIDLENKSCHDREGNSYNLHKLSDAIGSFSTEDENIEKRLEYDWKKVKESFCEDEAEEREIKEDEFSIFLEKFLNWGKNFSIDGKDVVDMKVSSSGGADVRLIFSGGTIQPLELEHDWKNYIDHGHPNSNAWANCWLFAEEEWDGEKILKLFSDLKKQHGNRIPDVFLCIENGERKAYKVDWDNNKFDSVDLSFPERA